MTGLGGKMYNLHIKIYLCKTTNTSKHMNQHAHTLEYVYRTTLPEKKFARLKQILQIISYLMCVVTPLFPFDGGSSGNSRVRN